MKTIVAAACVLIVPALAHGQAVSDSLLTWLSARSDPAKLSSNAMRSDASTLFAALDRGDADLRRFAIDLPASGLAPHMTRGASQFHPPYYAMVHGARHLGFSVAGGANARWRFGLLSEGSRHADPLPSWTPYAKRTLLSVEYERRAGPAVAIVSGGVLRESGALLGTVQPNALMPGGSARTTFAALSLGYALTPRWSLVGMASAGRTQGLDQEQRLGAQHASVSTAALSVGLSGRQVWTRDDCLGITLTVPNKVTQGAGSLSGAALHREDGALSFTTRNLNLAPNATESDLELSYSRRAGAQGRLAAAAMLRMHPGHDAATPRELLFGVRYSRQF